MSKKRFIDTHFWSDTWVDELGRDERYFFLYLLTNDKTSIAGVYEIPLKMIAFETGFNKQEVMNMFQNLQHKVRYINGWVVLRNGIKNQNFSNIKIARGIEIILEECPSELLEFIEIPAKIGGAVDKYKKKNKQRGLFDGSSMGHDSASHSDTEFELDSDSNSEAGLPTQDSNKFEGNLKTPAQRKAYAIAMEKEREQARRVAKATTRGASKPTTIERKWR